MATFNPKAARTRRPLPFWVDAFLRDTQHLQADETGAYLLILMAMWSRESCDLPDEDIRLARVSRVSTRLWKSRIGPVIRQFLMAENGAVFSEYLRAQAAYVERHVTQQSDRKTGKISGKALEDDVAGHSADISTDKLRNHPTQQPNNLSKTLLADAIRGDAPGDAFDIDDKKHFWANAKAYLRQNGVSEKTAGSFIGKCVRDHSLARAREVFQAAEEARAAEPIPWISAILNKPQYQPAINDNVDRILNQQLGIDLE